MIKGLAWDHRRCWGPLEASIDAYKDLMGVAVQWDRRTLYSFGEGDLTDFLDEYDLIIYDHPFVGDVAENGWMINLNRYLSDTDRAAFVTDSVGASWRSYGYNGGVWALPIDSAAQTAAWRADLMDAYGLQVPATMADAVELARHAPELGLRVGWPAKPTDVMCALMSLTSGLDAVGDGLQTPYVAPDVAAQAINMLSALCAASHAQSASWNPIQCFDHMTHADDVIYAPFAFNYVNYATAPDRALTFGAPPRASADARPCGLLGGAGIGVSARSRDPKAAFDYAMHLCGRDMQSGLYVEAGGQPGSRTAWTSEACNALTNGFFRDTLPTMDAAYLRPTLPGFVGFFHEATMRVWDVVNSGASQAAFITWLNQTYATLLNGAKTQAAS